MKKVIFTLILIQLLNFAGTAQKIFHTRINKTDVSLRGSTVVLGEVTVSSATAGKVVLRFDGDCISTAGDMIILAASNTQQWGNNDNSVNVRAISADLNSNVFSHTRVYDVPAGVHSFYAVAENYSDMAGTGRASIYGSLTAEWFPEISGQAFVRHKGISQSNFNVEGAPVILAEQSINTPVSGKVVVRFDGICTSSDGDLIMLAANNTPAWNSYDGSSSIEIVDGEFDKNSFAHVRTYDVTPGEHTYYAVIENYYEIYGNGIASVYGSLTVAFYPDPAPVVTVHQGILQVGVSIENGPVNLGTLNLNAQNAGKVLLNFSGTCIGSFGDYIKLAASDTPNWSEHDGSIGFEPFSSDRNRTSFSHSRLFDVGPGDHQFYAVAQNVQEFFGSGLAVVYGSLTATFYPNESVSAEEPEMFRQISLSPNPASAFVTVDLASLDQLSCTLTLLDEKGASIKNIQRDPGAGPRETIDIGSLPKGLYFIRVNTATGSTSRSFIRL